MVKRSLYSDILLTWKTVTMAQRRESKFFLSGTVSPSLSEPNLHPNRCIPRILKRTKEKINRQQREIILRELILYCSIPNINTLKAYITKPYPASLENILWQNMLHHGKMGKAMPLFVCHCGKKTAFCYSKKWLDALGQRPGSVQHHGERYNPLLWQTIATRYTLIQTTPTAKVSSKILFRKRKILKQYFFNHDSRH